MLEVTWRFEAGAGASSGNHRRRMERNFGGNPKTLSPPLSLLPPGSLSFFAIIIVIRYTAEKHLSCPHAPVVSLAPDPDLHYYTQSKYNPSD